MQSASFNAATSQLAGLNTTLSLLTTTTKKTKLKKLAFSIYRTRKLRLDIQTKKELALILRLFNSYEMLLGSLYLFSLPSVACLLQFEVWILRCSFVSILIPMLFVFWRMSFSLLLAVWLEQKFALKKIIKPCLCVVLLVSFPSMIQGVPFDLGYMMLSLA